MQLPEHFQCLVKIFLELLHVFLQQVLANADQKLADIAVIDKQEQQQLLVDWNKTDKDFDAQQEIELGINSSLPPISPLRGDAYKASLLMRLPQVLCIHIIHPPGLIAACDTPLLSRQTQYIDPCVHHHCSVYTLL